MPEIPLTRGLFTAVDQEDYERLNQFKWCAHRRTLKGRFKHYAVRSGFENGRKFTVYMHKEILNIPGEIDHKDGNGLNNRRSNLRSATRDENLANREKQIGTSSKYKGVSLAKGRNKKWRVDLTVKGVHVSVGAFYDEKEAAIAYNEAAKKYFGEFARPNIIC